MKVLVAQLWLSPVNSFATPWTVACQSPLYRGFLRQEYWSGYHFLLQGNLPHPGIEPRSPTLEANALPSEPPGKSQAKQKQTHRYKEQTGNHQREGRLAK